MSDVLTIYDVATDEERPATQDDIALLQRRCFELATERDELRRVVADLTERLGELPST